MIDFEFSGIPGAAGIDYSDPVEICAYHHLLRMCLQCKGGLNFTERITPMLRSLMAEGRIWLKEVRLILCDFLNDNGSKASPLPHCSLGDISDMITAYGFIHRICLGAPPEEFMKSLRLQTVGRWLAGDRTISVTKIAILIHDQITENPRSIDGRYHRFFFYTTGKWVGELMRHGRFHDIPLAEAYLRLRHLLASDLYAFMDRNEEQRAKREWTVNHLIKDPSAYDTPTLMAAITFTDTAASRGYLLSNPTLITELLTRPDLHTFHRQAYRMSIESCGLEIASH